MVTVEKIDSTSRKAVNRYIRIQYEIFKDCPYWVPPILIDRRAQLNKKKHPFYEHSDADYFIASRDGKDVGCITAIENRSYNDYHGKKTANFYLFDTVDDQEVVSALFDTVFEWARARGLNQVVGPKGFGPLDGYGLLVEGFQERQMMTMMNYNHDYYPKLVEALGFTKEVDFVSHYFDVKNRLKFPERIFSISDRVEKRGSIKVKRFKSKRELLAWANKIGETYNNTFVNNWEYFPLSPREIDFVVDNIMMVASPKLIKIITDKDDNVIGFLFGFQDVSKALQRSGGRLFPFGLIDLMLELRRTDWIALNGAGVLPEFQGRGGNAVLYAETARTIESGQFRHADLTQVAESAVQMRNDLENIGGRPYKNHRVYTIDI